MADTLSLLIDASEMRIADVGDEPLTIGSSVSVVILTSLSLSSDSFSAFFKTLLLCGVTSFLESCFLALLAESDVLNDSLDCWDCAFELAEFPKNLLFMAGQYAQLRKERDGQHSKVRCPDLTYPNVACFGAI